MSEHTEQLRKLPAQVGRIQTIPGNEIPEMIPIREVCNRIPGLSYDFIRKGCLAGQIVHIRAGSKFLINFGRLVDFLNTSNGGDKP